MKIAYIYPEVIPSKKARSISVVNTFNEMNKISDSALFVDKNSNTEMINSAYNVNIPAHKVVKIRKKFLLKSNKIFNKNLLKHLISKKFDIIYVRHLKVAKYLIKNGFSIVFEAHEIFFKTFKEENKKQVRGANKLKSLEEYVYKRCSGIIFINKTLQKEFNKAFNDISNNQCIVYNGTEFEEKHVWKDFSSIDEIYYIGNFYKWKGVQDAIIAMANLKDLTLNIVGDDSNLRKNELHELCVSYGVEERVHFLGYKDSKEVRNILLNDAKITIIPNTKSIQNQFSMPIKLFEYISTSNVVVAADMKTIKEVIDDQENGFLFKSGSIDSLQDTLLKVAALPDKYLQSISKNAYKSSLEYTWKKRAENIYRFCNDIKNGN